MYTLKSPLRLPQTKKKDFIFNLNVYRISHYRTLNTMKIRYKAYMYEQISKLPILDKIAINYVYYPGTRRRTDLGNVIAVHQKFFEDALVEHGKLKDDDYTHIIQTRNDFGGLDKKNPRVEIIIKEIT